MLKNFNLVVSTYRGRENLCISELWYFAREMGDPGISARHAGVPGLITARTKLDPLRFVEKLVETVSERPWEVRFLLKVVPVQVVVDTDLEEIARAAAELAEQGIGPEESFKIEVRKRMTDLSRKSVIEAVAERIDRRVDLTSPQKIVQIEIIGPRTGVSVITPGQIFSAERIRRPHLR